MTIKINSAFIAKRFVWLAIHTALFTSFHQKAIVHSESQIGINPIAGVTMVWQAPATVVNKLAMDSIKSKSSLFAFTWLAFICNMIFYNYCALKRHQEGRKSWLANNFGPSKTPVRSGSGVYFTKTVNGNTIVKPDGTPQIFTGYPENPNTHSKWN